jgi:hypothetical protein
MLLAFSVNNRRGKVYKVLKICRSFSFRRYERAPFIFSVGRESVGGCCRRRRRRRRPHLRCRDQRRPV